MVRNLLTAAMPMGASQIRLDTDGRAEKHGIVMIGYKSAGCQLCNLRFIRISASMVLDTFRASVGFCKSRVLDETFRVVVLAGGPFVIYEKPKTIIK